MGLFGGSSKVTNSSTTNVDVSVSPQIQVDINQLADAQQKAAQAIGSAFTDAGGGLAQGFQAGAQQFAGSLKSSVSTLAIALVGGALLVAVGRR